MTDSLTTRKALTLQTIGGNADSWGTILNATLDSIDKAIGGTLAKELSGDVTLSSTEAQNIAYVFSGSPASACTVTWPAFYGQLMVRNATTVAVTCKMSTGSTIHVPASTSALIHSNSVDFKAIAQDLVLDVRRFGADPTGVADSTVALNTAAAVGLPLHLPAGTYKVTDIITLANGQIIRGDGCTKTIISVPATFNLAALGVVRLGTSAQGAAMFDIGITFTQPDVTTKAGMTQYPPAIYAVDVPRFVVDRVRISGAWNGIKATGNSGGACIGFVEIGAINKGIEMGGSLDFVHGGHWHFWVFGFQTANQLVAWAAAGSIAMDFGLVESLEIGSVTTYQGRLNFTAATTQSVQQISRLSLDGNGSTLSVVGQKLAVGSLYTTKDGSSTSASVTVGLDGELSVQYIEQYVGHPYDDFVVNNATGRLLINSGISYSASLITSAFWVSAGVMTLNNIQMKHPASGTRTVAMVRQTGTGVLRMAGNQWSSVGAVVGSALTMDGEQILHNIVNNDFLDWPVQFPPTVANGEYGPNNTTVHTVTPSVTFSTNGDFVPTYTTRSTQYHYMGSGTVWFQTIVLFDTNAFTTAAGGFQIAIGTPAVPIVEWPVTLADLANVTFNSANLTGAIIGTDNKVLLRLFTSDFALAGMGPTNILPSKTGVLFRVSGTFRYK